MAHHIWQASRAPAQGDRDAGHQESLLGTVHYNVDSLLQYETQFCCSESAMDSVALRRSSSCAFEIVAWRTRVQACSAAQGAARTGPEHVTEKPSNRIINAMLYMVQRFR